MKDKELVTLWKALELEKNDGVVIRTWDIESGELSKPTIYVADGVYYDKDTGVSYLKTHRGKIIMAGDIASLEHNRMLSSKGNGKAVNGEDIA